MVAELPRYSQYLYANPDRFQRRQPLLALNQPAWILDISIYSLFSFHYTLSTNCVALASSNIQTLPKLSAYFG